MEDPEIEALMIISSAYGNSSQADSQFRSAVDWLYARPTSVSTNLSARLFHEQNHPLQVISWRDFRRAFGPPETAASPATDWRELRFDTSPVAGAGR